MALTAQQVQEYRKKYGLTQSNIGTSSIPAGDDKAARKARINAIAEQSLSKRSGTSITGEQPKKTFLQKAGSFVKELGNDIASSFGRTGGRFAVGQITKPFFPGGTENPLVSKGLEYLGVPENIKLPGTNVDIGIRRPTESKKALMSLGEDFLNVLPGGTVKKTAQELIEKGAQTTAGRLIQSAFKIPLPTIEKNPTIIKDILGLRVTGISKKSIASKMDEALQQSVKELDNIIEQAGTRQIQTSEVTSVLRPLKELYQNSAFADEYVPIIENKISSFLKNNGSTMSVKAAQEFKENTYKLLRKSYGEMSQASTEASKQINRGIKESIEKAIPEFKVAEANKKIAILGKARDLMEKEIAKDAKGEVFKFKDIVIGGAGAATGLTPQAIFAILGNKVIMGAPFKTFTAKVLTSTKTQALKNLAKKFAPFIGQSLKTVSDQNKRRR